MKMTLNHHISNCSDCPLCECGWDMGFTEYNCKHPTSPAENIPLDEYDSPREDSVPEDCPLRRADLKIELCVECAFEITDLGEMRTDHPQEKSP